MSKDDWGTPEKFFKALDEQFDFTLDPCANPVRLLKPRGKMVSLTMDQDGLKGDWTDHVVFVNPPYSGKQLEDIAKIKMEDLNDNDVDDAVKIIAGTARSMGVVVEG